MLGMGLPRHRQLEDAVVHKEFEDNSKGNQKSVFCYHHILAIANNASDNAFYPIPKYVVSENNCCNYYSNFITDTHTHFKLTPFYYLSLNDSIDTNLQTC